MKNLLEQMMEGLRSGKQVRAYMYEDKIFALDDWIEFLIGSGTFPRAVIHEQLDALIIDGSETTFEYIDKALTKHLDGHGSSSTNCPVASLQIEWRKRHNLQNDSIDTVQTELSAEEINQMYAKAFEGDDDGRTAQTAQGTTAKADADSPAEKAARKVGKRKKPGAT